MLWAPEDATVPTPPVLIGHRGNGHKCEDHLVALARRLVRHNVIAADTIDGPAHEDRAPEEAKNEFSADRRKRFTEGRITKPLVEDWTDDELVPRDRASELLAKNGSANRCLHVNPGLHSAVPQEEILNTQDSLAQHLSGESG